MNTIYFLKCWSQWFILFVLNAPCKLQDLSHLITSNWMLTTASLLYSNHPFLPLPKHWPDGGVSPIAVFSRDRAFEGDRGHGIQAWFLFWFGSPEDLRGEKVGFQNSPNIFLSPASLFILLSLCFNISSPEVSTSVKLSINGIFSSDTNRYAFSLHVLTNLEN